MAELPGGPASSAGTLNTGQTTQRTYYQTGSGTYTVNEPVFTSAASLMQLPQKLFAQGDFASLQQINKLVKDGGFSSWEEALMMATQDPEKGSRSWQEYLQQHTQKYQAFLKANGDIDGSAGSGSADGPFRNEQTNVSLSSDSTAAGLLDQVYQQELGRMASEPEIRAFQTALNKMQSANPSTTVQTGNTANRNTTSTSTTTTGFDPARFATEWARSRPEYAEVTAATTFMDLLDRAISNPNAIDQMIAGN